MKRSAAEVLREYGPFPGAAKVNGVTYDGRQVWFASGDKLNALDPESGKTVRSIDVAAHAGTAFDGRHLFQLSDDRIQKIDPKTGNVLATNLPLPEVPVRGWRGPKERFGWGNIGTGRSIKSIRRPERSSVPSRQTASLPASRGSTGNSGTPPWKVTRATCDELIRKPGRSWRNSTCRREWACRGLSPMAAIGSSAAAAALEK